MKLERYHIIPYLDHRLKFKDYYSEQVVEIIGISKVVNADKTINEDTIILYLSSDETILIDQSRFQLIFKPILRPLSDLTKEIEIDGEKFTPLISLLNIYQGEFSSKFINEELEVFTSGTTYVLEYLFTNPDMSIYREKFNFGYSEYLQSFHSYGNSTSKRNHVDHQLSLFLKLFEWRFDIFNLIPEGLAIDVNTIMK